MQYIRGKAKGKDLKLVQFANDWMMAESDERPNIIVKPTQVEVDDAELERMRSVADPGHFWRLWQPYEHAEGVWRFRKLTPGATPTTEGPERAGELRRSLSPGSRSDIGG